jgi:CheY-like chemotaxis protein
LITAEATTTMTNPKLNICHYPATTLLIDDNEDFLSHIHHLLIKHQLPAQYYSDPQQALDFLNNHYRPDPFVNRCMTSDPDRDIDSRITNFDFRKIHHEIYNPHRFSQIAALCIDYAMPAMDGLHSASWLLKISVKK